MGPVSDLNVPYDQRMVVCQPPHHLYNDVLLRKGIHRRLEYLSARKLPSRSVKPLTHQSRVGVRERGFRCDIRMLEVRDLILCKPQAPPPSGFVHLFC